MFTRSNNVPAETHLFDAQDGRAAAVSVLPGIPLPPGLLTFTPDELATAVDEAFAPERPSDELVSVGAPTAYVDASVGSEPVPVPVPARRGSFGGLRKRPKSEDEVEPAEAVTTPIEEDPLFHHVPVQSEMQVAAAPLPVMPIGPPVALPPPAAFAEVVVPAATAPARPSFLSRLRSPVAPVLEAPAVPLPPPYVAPSAVAPPPPYVPAPPSAPPLEAEAPEAPESVVGELVEDVAPDGARDQGHQTHAEIVHEELVEAHLLDPDPVDASAVPAFAHLVPTQQLTSPSSSPSVGLVFADGSLAEIGDGPEGLALAQVAGVLAGDPPSSPSPTEGIEPIEGTEPIE